MVNIKQLAEPKLYDPRFPRTEICFSWTIIIGLLSYFVYQLISANTSFILVKSERTLEEYEDLKLFAKETVAQVRFLDDEEVKLASTLEGNRRVFQNQQPFAVGTCDFKIEFEYNING